jgi:hypothetical protein
MNFVILRGGTDRDKIEWVEANLSYRRIISNFQLFCRILTNAEYTKISDWTIVIKPPNDNLWAITPYIYMLEGRAFKVVTLLTKDNYTEMRTQLVPPELKMPTEELLVPCIDEGVLFDWRQNLQITESEFNSLKRRY